MHLNAGFAIFCGDLLQYANGQLLFDYDLLEPGVHRLQIYSASDARNAHVPELVPQDENACSAKLGLRQILRITAPSTLDSRGTPIIWYGSADSVIFNVVPDQG